MNFKRNIVFSVSSCEKETSDLRLDTRPSTRIVFGYLL
jgi:hypothetical protein